MHIAIDDTYGPTEGFSSKFVTPKRRTHVAVIFEDQEVDYIRQQITDCLDYCSELLPSAPSEFHFAEIYNKRGEWKHCEGEINLKIIEAFAHIYQLYEWPVLIQTIDQRTLSDHPHLVDFPMIDGLRPKSMDDLSLYLLCLKIRQKFKAEKKQITLYLDQGKGNPDKEFGKQFFVDWGERFIGKYASSTNEPLVQIADFLAFVINRQTYLSIKKKRSDIDNWFIETVSSMKINSEELVQEIMPVNFTTSDFDQLHSRDRIGKGLK